MLKLTLEYVDFDGHKQVEDLYFNISMNKLADKELRSGQTWFKSLEAIQNADGKTTKDANEIMDRFYEIIGLSYGQRSEDGKYFRQSQQLWEDFQATAAYDAFFMKICTDAGYAAEFINAVLPAELIERVKAQQKAADEAAAQQQVQAEAAVIREAVARPTEIPTQPSAPVVWPPAEA